MASSALSDVCATAGLMSLSLARSEYPCVRVLVSYLVLTPGCVWAGVAVWLRTGRSRVSCRLRVSGSGFVALGPWVREVREICRKKRRRPRPQTSQTAL